MIKLHYYSKSIWSIHGLHGGPESRYHVTTNQPQTVYSLSSAPSWSNYCTVWHCHVGWIKVQIVDQVGVQPAVCWTNQIQNAHMCILSEPRMNEHQEKSKFSNGNLFYSNSIRHNEFAIQIYVWPCELGFGIVNFLATGNICCALVIFGLCKNWVFQQQQHLRCLLWAINKFLTSFPSVNIYASISLPDHLSDTPISL